MIGRSEHIIPLLGVASWLGFGVLCLIRPTDSILVPLLGMPAASSIPLQQDSADPAMGVQFPVNGADLFGRSMPDNHPFVFASVGSCGGCSLASLNPTDLASRLKVPLVIGYSNNRDEVLAALERKSEPPYLVMAELLDAERLALNDYFHPRLYVFGSGKQLRAIQAVHETAEEFLGSAGVLK